MVCSDNFVTGPNDDGEDGDSEITEQLQSNDATDEPDGQSDVSSHSETEHDVTEPEVFNQEEGVVDEGPPNEGEITPSSDSKDTDLLEEGRVDLDMSPRRLEVMNKLCFPSDLLSLRKVEEAEFLQTGIPWSVSTAIPLEKGRSIGPYQGELVALSSIKPGELVLQFQSGSGEFAFIKVTEDAGAWLALLKPADTHTVHNTRVYFEGDHIWCEAVQELSPGTELTASFTTNTGRQPHSPPPRGRDGKLATALPARTEVKVSRNSAGKSDSKPTSQLSPQPALIYGCPFCGVRFSSPRTLEAHITYYCSKKPADFLSLQQLQKQLAFTPTPATPTSPGDTQTVGQAELQEAPSPTSDVEGKTNYNRKRPMADMGDPHSSPDSAVNVNRPHSKSPKTGEMYKCLSCDYHTDKMSSLNRHKRMHVRDVECEEAMSSERMSVSPQCLSEMYCKHCNIQFTSMGTYKGHREFYCQYRNRHRDSDDNVSEGASPAMEQKSPNTASAAISAIDSSLSPKLLNMQALIENSNKGLLFNTGLLNIHPTMMIPNLVESPLLLQAISKDMKKFPEDNMTNGNIQKLSPDTAKDNINGGGRMSDDHLNNDEPLDLSTRKPQATFSSAADMPDTVDVPGDVRQSDSMSVRSESCSPQTSPAAKKQKLSDEVENGDSARLPTKPTLNIPTIHPTLTKTGPIPYVNTPKLLSPQQLVSRCVECNIVFYKHENFLIHKEHYCSGRRSEADTVLGKEQTDSRSSACDSESSPSTQTVKDKLAEILSPRKAKSPSLEASTLVKVSTPRQNEICYRYYCIPCKIKFSSNGNLKAHKEFYCPHGKDNEMTMVVKEPANDATNRDARSPVEESMVYHCDGCDSEFSSSRLLKLHFCTGLSNAVPLLRCPYCDYVTQTENRLSEHMKVHIPTKAFKCTICGYRGNTARGMRMHGKMHVENGEEFTDDNMVEFEEPPVVPIQRNGVLNKGPVTMETELIRMKNEPYKRRRSRKSFEKSENMPQYLGQGILPQLCPACGQVFSSLSEFIIHLRMHEIAALEAMKCLKSLKCEHCSDYVADSLTSLLAHMQAKHPEQFPSISKSENSHSESEGERSQSRDSHRTNENRSRSNSMESSRASNSVSSHEQLISEQTKLEGVHVNSGSATHNGEHAGQVPLKLTIKTEPLSLASEDQQISSGTEVEAPPRYRSDSQKDLKDIIQTSNHCHGYSENSKSPVRSHNSGETSDAGSTTARSPNNNNMSPPSEQVIKRSPRQQVSPHQMSPVTSHPLRSSLWHALLANAESMKPEHVLSHKLILQPNIPSQSSQHADNEQRSPSPHDRTPSPVKSDTSPRPKRSNSPCPQLPPVAPNLPLLYSPQAMLSLYQLPGGIPNPLASAASVVGSSSVLISPDKNGHKYCKHCDINFTYLSSFLTHKKYYCSARSSADELSPSASA